MINKMTVTEFLDKGYKFTKGDEYSSPTCTRMIVGLDITKERANEYHPFDHRRYVISAKALEEPCMKVTYEKATDSLFGLESDFNNGKLYFKLSDGEYHKITKELTFSYGYYASNLYRKVEITPMDAAKEACQEFVKTSKTVGTSASFDLFINTIADERYNDLWLIEFIELCRATVNAYDGK